jgi:hypothetical protein
MKERERVDHEPSGPNEFRPSERAAIARGPHDFEAISVSYELGGVHSFGTATA